MNWEQEHALDGPDDLDVSAYDVRCKGCGAIYSTCPRHCQLCGCEEFEPFEDLAW